MSKEVKGVITWLYYNDFEKAVKYYEDVLGFPMVVDQGWSTIHEIREGAYVGVVDGARGYHKANPIKPVILCINVIDADAWHKKLTDNGVKIEEKPKESERLKIKVFMFNDIEGYTIEIQETLSGGLSI